MNALLLGLCLMTIAPLGAAADESTAMQTWHAHVVSPGGKLPFLIEIEAPDNTGASSGAEVEAFIVNGGERVAVPRALWNGRRLELHITHYASTLILERRDRNGDELHGEWRRLSAGDTETVMPVMATQIRPPRQLSRANGNPLDGRWRVDFETDDQPAVGVFGTVKGRLLGTFITTTGDYRYLAGRQLGGHFELSVFDGSHAFLFTGSVQADGSLKGDFWSRDSHHETFTAVRDPDMELPDGFGLTRWDKSANVNALSFPDLSGTLRTLGDADFAGKARIVQVFGSWCPNCHDASDFLAELHARYADRGLSIVGLAFEFTSDPARAAEQVQRYADLHGAEWPLLLAGISRKSEAVKALPFLEALNSYPTTLFVRADGSVRAVYQGFSGPATGESYTQLKASFEALVEELLDEGA
ncbi:MAG: hypothetical protein DHS20C15_28590 [Planctomycetota bacterium]|nr:MAG: hypothetical protein DHS20C15_28590 [Planctomycetota bacterium]